jgi:hypothetical protein
MYSRIIESFTEKCFIPIPDPSFMNENKEDNLYDKFRHKSVSELKKSGYTTWKFNAGDNSTTFSENLKKYKDTNWRYKDKVVNYTVNSFGYRTKQFDEIDWANSIVIFGCSFVCGVGVDNKHTVTSFLEQELGIPVINMGIAGSSNNFHLHNSTILSSFYPTPRAVIHGYCGLSRHTGYYPNTVIHYGNWYKEKYSERHEFDFTIQNMTSMLSVKNMWKHKTVYIDFSWNRLEFDFIKKTLPDCETHYIDWNRHRELSKENMLLFSARDLHHPGEILNKHAASQLAKILKSYNV